MGDRGSGRGTATAPRPSTGRKPGGGARRKRKQPPALQIAAAIARKIEEQRRELTGVILLFLGAVGGLGMYGDLAGPAGRAVEWMFRVAIGSVAVALPPVLCWIGVLLLRRGEHDQPGRVAAGAALTLAGLGGISYLAGSDLRAGIRLDQLPSLGGVFGALLAWPLQRVLSVWGAGLLLALVAGLGLLVTTRTPLRDVGVWMRATGRALARAVADGNTGGH